MEFGADQTRALLLMCEQKSAIFVYSATKCLH